MTTPMLLKQLRYLSRNPKGKVLPLTYDYDSQAEWVDDDGEDGLGFSGARAPKPTPEPKVHQHYHQERAACGLYKQNEKSYDDAAFAAFAAFAASGWQNDRAIQKAHFHLTVNDQSAYNPYQMVLPR
ncbi:Uu.00g113290.m01.CDS01 [Anthostomella pinea]|uniref:Uu.00g113290.m01.CDS01 n=1 Tax=Anthostomella pinea TaxID=933095 RepID=A0AAI8VFG5_9PEZI|nr:Uu.00g113290.m01.CDS01 [Anthostomella pinea]